MIDYAYIDDMLILNHQSDLILVFIVVKSHCGRPLLLPKKDKKFSLINILMVYFHIPYISNLYCLIHHLHISILLLNSLNISFSTTCVLVFYYNSMAHTISIYLISNPDLHCIHL